MGYNSRRVTESKVCKISKFEIDKSKHTNEGARYLYDLYSIRSKEHFMMMVIDKESKEIFWRPIDKFKISFYTNEVAHEIGVETRNTSAESLRNNIDKILKKEIGNNIHTNGSVVIANEIVEEYGFSGKLTFEQLVEDVKEQRIEILNYKKHKIYGVECYDYRLDLDRGEITCKAEYLEELSDSIKNHIMNNETNLCSNETEYISKIYRNRKKIIRCKKVKSIEKIDKNNIKMVLGIEAEDLNDKLDSLYQDNKFNKYTESDYVGYIIASRWGYLAWRISKKTGIFEYISRDTKEEIVKSGFFNSNSTVKRSISKILALKCKSDIKIDKLQLNVVNDISKYCQSGKYTIDEIAEMIDNGKIVLRKVKENDKYKIKYNDSYRVAELAYILRPQQLGRSMTVEVTFRYGTSFERIREIVRKELKLIYLDLEEAYNQTDISSRYNFKDFKLRKLNYLNPCGLLFEFRLSDDVDMSKKDINRLKQNGKVKWAKTA